MRRVEIRYQDVEFSGGQLPLFALYSTTKLKRAPRINKPRI